MTFKIGMVLKSISKTRLEDRVQGIWCKVRSLTWRLIRMAWHDVRLRLETWRVIGIRIGFNCCVKFHVYNGIYVGNVNVNYSEVMLFCNG